MDSGLYAAYTGLLARTQAMDTAANNLANAGTTAFRAGRDSFRSVIVSGLLDGVQGSQVGETVNQFGVLGGSTLDLGQGPLVNTANPLDLALDGAGMFAIQTAQGIRYTRDGGFQRSADGTLTTRQGEAVLDSALEPLSMPTGTVEVSGNGTVSVDGGIVGKVGVFSVNAADLKAEGIGRFAVAEGVTPAAVEVNVKQGALEGANQDAVHGTMQLILVQRQAEMMQKALSAFDTGFDKTAVEELGKV